MIERHPEWEATYKNTSLILGSEWGECLGVWYQGSALKDRHGWRHWLINHGHGDLGRLSKSYENRHFVERAIRGIPVKP